MLQQHSILRALLAKWREPAALSAALFLAATGAALAAAPCTSPGAPTTTETECLTAHSGDCDRPFQPKVITDSGDRDHAVMRPEGPA